MVTTGLHDIPPSIRREEENEEEEEDPRTKTE